MRLSFYLRLLFLLFSITLCSCLKCYTCTSSSAKNCYLKQRFEHCEENKNTCLTIYHTDVIHSGNKTLVKSRFLKSCVETTRNCNTDYCRPFADSKYCRAYCCNREGCNKFDDPVVISAKYTSYGEILLPFYSLIQIVVVIQYL
nr:uncharacterized protein LOC105845033 [Hydra vulgaris]